MPDESIKRRSIQGKLKLPSFLFVGSDYQLLTTPPHHASSPRLPTTPPHFACFPPAGMALPFARSCGSVAHEVQSRREGYAVPLISRECLFIKRNKCLPFPLCRYSTSSSPRSIAYITTSQ